MKIVLCYPLLCIAAFVFFEVRAARKRAALFRDAGRSSAYLKRFYGCLAACLGLALLSAFLAGFGPFYAVSHEQGAPALVVALGLLLASALLFAKVRASKREQPRDRPTEKRILGGPLG